MNWIENAEHHQTLLWLYGLSTPRASVPQGYSLTIPAYNDELTGKTVLSLDSTNRRIQEIVWLSFS